MNKTARFLSIAAVAAFASFGAQADEADASQFATSSTPTAPCAEVQSRSFGRAPDQRCHPRRFARTGLHLHRGPQRRERPGRRRTAHRQDLVRRNRLPVIVLPPPPSGVGKQLQS